MESVLPITQLKETKVAKAAKVTKAAKTTKVTKPRTTSSSHLQRDTGVGASSKRGVKTTANKGSKHAAKEKIVDLPRIQTQTGSSNFYLTYGPNFSNKNSVSCLQRYLKQNNEMKSCDKDKTVHETLCQVIKSDTLFENITDDLLNHIVNSMYKIVIEKHEFIIKSGEMGDAYFILQSGQLSIWKYDDHDDNQRKKIVKCVLEEYSSFGEQSLLFNEVRNVNVEAITDNCIIWALDKKEFNNARSSVTLLQNKAINKKIRILKKLDFLSNFNIQDLKWVANSLKRVQYKKGECLYRYNEQSTHFFIVLEGVCGVRTRRRGRSLKSKSHSRSKSNKNLKHSKNSNSTGKHSRNTSVKSNTNSNSNNENKHQNNLFDTRAIDEYSDALNGNSKHDQMISPAATVGVRGSATVSEMRKVSKKSKESMIKATDEPQLPQLDSEFSNSTSGLNLDSFEFLDSYSSYNGTSVEESQESENVAPVLRNTVSTICKGISMNYISQSAQAHDTTSDDSSSENRNKKNSKYKSKSTRTSRRNSKNFRYGNHKNTKLDTNGKVYVKGDYFGHDAIVNDETRKKTVVALTDCVCYLMPATNFKKIIRTNSKHTKNNLKQNSLKIGTKKSRKYKDDTPNPCCTRDSKDYNLGSIFGDSNNNKNKNNGENDATTPPPKGKSVRYDEFSFKKKFENRVKCKLEDLVCIDTLGVGTFGTVALVEDLSTNKTFSLKKIHKNRVVECKQEKHVCNERAILACLHSKFCIKLYATYKDEFNVYFLTEAVLGGELFYLLKCNKQFSEKTSKFYAACVVCALRYLHSKNIVFRDLKPENVCLLTLLQPERVFLFFVFVLD